MKKRTCGEISQLVQNMLQATQSLAARGINVKHQAAESEKNIYNQMAAKIYAARLPKKDGKNEL